MQNGLLDEYSAFPCHNRDDINSKRLDFVKYCTKQLNTCANKHKNALAAKQNRLKKRIQEILNSIETITLERESERQLKMYHVTSIIQFSRCTSRQADPRSQIHA